MNAEFLKLRILEAVQNLKMHFFHAKVQFSLVPPQFRPVPPHFFRSDDGTGWSGAVVVEGSYLEMALHPT